MNAWSWPQAACACGALMLRCAFSNRCVPCWNGCSVALTSADAISEALRTVTLKLPAAVLPCASLAEQFTVVVPIPNIDPDAGMHDTGTAPSTTSLAVAGYVTAAPSGDVGSATMSAGSVSTGGIVSVAKLNVSPLTAAPVQPPRT